MERVKLFCVPYAGGSAMIYKKWGRYLHNSIELVPIELAGRGNRYKQPLYKKFEDAVNDVYDSIKMHIDKSPYMLFGHSMGGSIVYELTHKIMEGKHNLPKNIFISGSKPPNTKEKSRLIYNLPDDEFWNEIFSIGGTPRELFENNELMELYLPIIREDYRITETHIHMGKSDRLNCNITVLNGLEDIDPEVILKWREYTLGTCNIYNFDGGHFFINDNTEKVVNIINDTLTIYENYKNVDSFDCI